MTDPLDQFLEGTQRAIEAIRQKLRGEQDWHPILLMEAPKGFHMLPLAGREGDHGYVTEAIMEARATLAARVQLTIERGSGRELLVLTAADNTRARQVIAEVTRADDEPPTLGEWQEARADVSLLATTLRRAVEAAARQN